MATTPDSVVCWWLALADLFLLASVGGPEMCAGGEFNNKQTR